MSAADYVTLTFPDVVVLERPDNLLSATRYTAPDGSVDVGTTTPPAGGGRGAFPRSGLGGTLNAAGNAPGRFYRSPAPGAPASVLAPGTVGYRAVRDGGTVSINDYAVYRAVIFLQRTFGETPDGILGPKTDAKIKAWQSSRGLFADGVYGPSTAKTLLTPYVHEAAELVDPGHSLDLANIMIGTIGWESGWDHGAVGVQDPRDLGIAQVHLPMHTELSVNDALDPSVSIRWMARFIDSNLVRMNYNVRDAVAAYNLGVGGARKWVAAGRPQMWRPDGSYTERDVWRYIDSILSA